MNVTSSKMKAEDWHIFMCKTEDVIICQVFHVLDDYHYEVCDEKRQEITKSARHCNEGFTDGLIT